MIFECKYCPERFQSFKQLAEHYETEHNPDSEQYRKIRESVSYSGPDSGCKAASDYLGSPSHCLSCPFRNCIYDENSISPAAIRKRQRDEEVIELFRGGKTVPEIAALFKVHERTIQRTLGKTK